MAQKAAVLTPIIISMCQLMADDGPNSSIIHRPDSRGDKSPLLVKKSQACQALKQIPHLRCAPSAYLLDSGQKHTK